MSEMLINVIIAALVLGLTYALTSEGLWGSALMFFNVVFGGMITFNFYEPLADMIDKTGINWGGSEALCILLLFGVSVLLLRLTTESLAPAMVRFPMPIYHAGRLFFGLAGACVTMAILILAHEAAPVHKKVYKAIAYDTKPPFGLGFDHQWLGFFQFETGAVFVQYSNAGQPDPYRTFGQGRSIKLFDPKGQWLIDHQNNRPYGTETVPPEESDSSSDSGGGGSGAGQAAGGGGAGRRGGR